MKQDVTPRLLSIEGAASYMGVSKRTVEEYIATGQVRTYRLPGRNGEEFLKRTLLERSEIDKLIDRGVRI